MSESEAQSGENLNQSGETGDVSIDNPAKPVQGMWQDVFGENTQLSGGSQLADFKSADDFVKSFNSAQDMISRSIRIPTDEAGDEQKQQFMERLVSVDGVFEMPVKEDPASMDRFYNKIGRPADAMGYEIDVTDAMPMDDQQQLDFKQFAHSIGLTQDQARAIHDRANEGMATRAGEENESYESDMGNLKKEWGLAFDRNLGMSQAVMAIFESLDPGITDYMESRHMDTDPRMIRLFHGLHARFSEPMVHKPGEVGSIMTPAEAERVIADARNNPDHPSRNPGHPGYEVASKEIERMYMIARGIQQ